MPSQEAESSLVPTKKPLKLITSLKDFSSPSLAYSPAALLTKPSLRDATSFPIRTFSRPTDGSETHSSSKKSRGSLFDLNTNISTIKSGPKSHTRRRSQTWTSPTDANLTTHQISNTLSSIERPGPLLPPMITRSPSASCLLTDGDRMGHMLPPPRRPRSRSSLKPPGPNDDEISYLAEFSLNISDSPSSINSDMGTISTTTSASPMSNDNKGMSALPRVPSLKVSRRGSLYRQHSNSSIAEPRLANVEVTSRWSTEALHPRHPTRELSDLREACISSAADKPVNPFLSGFRAEHLRRANSVSKQEGVRPSPLRATHQRHVSAPMVSSSIATFIIPPPLEMRPRSRESPHRKATTCLSRQPSRLEMRGRDGLASPIMRQRTLSTASTDRHTEGEPATTKIERPSLSKMFSGSWSHNLLDSSFLPRRSRHIVSTIKQNSDRKAQVEQDFSTVARNEEEEEDGEDETEVFLGLDDI